LIIDDDVRNVFAVSAALEAQRMVVSYADDGRKGIEQLTAGAEVDLVLMDIMMPEMDGYETMRAIRGTLGLTELPIVAVTAKALPGDREKAIAAGANDYVTKPVDLDRLLAVIRARLQGDRTGSGDAGSGDAGSGDVGRGARDGEKPGVAGAAVRLEDVEHGR
jgi:CheY-like chemotaxis protein